MISMLSLFGAVRYLQALVFGAFVREHFYSFA
jgi:hypothetical protein